MAGNCDVARAGWHLPLARERQKSAPAQALVRRYTLQRRLGPTHNILWHSGAKNPPNCVFFACNPQTPAVLTQ
jgi:hypothetical protein